MTHFADRLQEAIASKRSPCCVGIDPFPDRLPQPLLDLAVERHGLSAEALCHAVREFCQGVLEAVAPFVPVVKPQAAFFEALGPEGARVLAEVVDRARELGLLVLADVKRGDIGTTSGAYAAGLFGRTTVRGIPVPSLQADAATVNPYLGGDGVLPFVEKARMHGCGVYVLARTSNPGSAEFQELALENGGTTVDEVARAIARWGRDSIGRCGFSDVGAVVGATHLEAARRMRELMPQTPFLVPGWGAQGGAQQTVRACFDREGRGALVNSSRGVIFAWQSERYRDFGETRWKEAVAEAARDFAAEIAGLAAEPA